MRAAATGAIVWLTGLPASGKTTVARQVVARLNARGDATLWLDSDDLRPILTPSPSYDAAERDHFYRALGQLAARAARGGAVAVVSATAHRRAWRDAARALVDRFVEVFIDVDRGVAEARDPKGLYERARSGEIARLPGVGVPFEAPLAPELRVDGRRPADALAKAIVAALDAT